MAKTHDLVVVVGTYEKNGETKNRYKNIGSVIENEKGSYIILDRTFNPAGLPNPDNRDSCFVSLFEVKEKETQAEWT